MNNPYAVLDVAQDASSVEIKRAFRKLAMRWHPDRNPDDPDAEQRFKEVSAAYELLSDPAQRAELGTLDARAMRGELPEEFIEEVASAIERAQIWIERVVLPHYASSYRGRGAEMAARLVHDVDGLVDASKSAPPIPLLARWRAYRLTRGWEVTMQPIPSASLSLLRRGRTFEIQIVPFALWHAGIREGAEIDLAVMQVLLARYAQLVAMGRYVPDGRPAEEAIAAASALDQAHIQARLRRGLSYGLFLAFAAFLLYAGATNWRSC